MTMLLQFAAFALGSYLSMRMIAALHGPVDVWHLIGKAWPRVAADILVWVAAIAVVAWLMEGTYRTALVWGMAIYLVFYLSLLPLAHLYWARRRSERNID